MREILLFGGGRSAYFLIEYLLAYGQSHDWHLTVADAHTSLVEGHFAPHDRLSVVRLDIHDVACRKPLIQAAELVLSLLPPTLHPLVAEDCVAIGRSLMTASYNAPEMEKMDGDLRRKGLFFLLEMGFDPGIDHMSAMQELDTLRAEGHKINAFHSYAGGLMQEAASQNPWGYKISWSPMNVVRAGSAGAHYRINGHEKFIPYTRIFQETHQIEVPEVGRLEAYCNRDALHYAAAYKLGNIPSMLRYTLRRPGFCAGWNALVHMGITDDHVRFRNLQEETYADFTARFSPKNPDVFAEDMYRRETNGELFPRQLRALGLLDRTPIGLEEASPAEVLLHGLLRNLSMASDDRDMTVMVHRISYTTPQGQTRERQVNMIVNGIDTARTAMARCVGLPMAIATRLFLENQLHLLGIQLPLDQDIYKPILSELEAHGIRFQQDDRAVRK